MASQLGGPYTPFCGMKTLQQEFKYIFTCGALASTDRVLAAAWLQKIKEVEAGPEKLRTDYIKLLLFALQRKKIVGIFRDDPSGYETLQEFPPGYNLNTMAKQLIEEEQKERINRIKKQLTGDIGDYPPYITDCSSDLREYVAAQDIPGFGIHCYYAISKYPVTSWYKSERGHCPKMVASTVNATSPLPPSLSQRASDTHLKVQTNEDATKSGKSLTDLPEDEPEKKKRKKKKIIPSPPVKPLGTKPFEDEDRISPNWSSNLLKVVETPQGDLSPRPSRSSGAFPKLAREKDLVFQEELVEIEKALEDFQRGELRKTGPKKFVYQFEQIKSEDEELDEFDETDAVKDYDTFLDLDESQYNEDINRDSLVIKYMKDTVDNSAAKKVINRSKAIITENIPAQSGIPITTPKPSVSPRRLQSSDKLYKQMKPILTVTQDELLESTIRNPQKDPEMTKLYLQASSIEEPEAEEFEPDFGYSDTEEPQFQYREDTPEEISEVQPTMREPMPPLTKGSPISNAILLEVIPSLEEGARTSAPGQYQSFQTPPRFPMRRAEELPLDQEMLYIDYLFPKDRKTAEMLKRVAHTVSDIEQDIPDPTGLYFPPSPPLADVGPMSFLEEETFDFPQSPPVISRAPPSSTPEPRGRSLPQPSSIGRPGGITKPSGLRPPSKIAKPVGFQSFERRGDSGIPCGSSKSDPSRIARPTSENGIARPTLSQPSSKTRIARPTGIQKPGVSRSTAITQTERSKTSLQVSPAHEFQRAPRPPREPLGPMYFPPTTMDVSEWPSPDVNLVDTLQRHQIDPHFRDSRRPQMRRRLVVGRTSGRTMPMQTRYVPALASRYPIAETESERYPVSPSRSSPESVGAFPDDETIFEFARGYVPPVYQSPPGLIDESPPQLVRAERGGAPTMRKFMEEQKAETERVIDSIRRTLEGYEQAEARQRLAEQKSVRRPHLTRRKLNFGEIDEDTDTYLSNVMARHPDLPPLSPSEAIPQRVVTPPRTGLPGWDSPERLPPSTPPFYRMPGSPQTLDAFEPPFAGVEMSPKDQDYFELYTQSGDYGEESNFFDADIDSEMFPLTPPRSPYQYESIPQNWYSQAHSPEISLVQSPVMSPDMQQMRQRLQQTEPMRGRTDRSYIFETPPRRVNPPRMSPITGSPPEEDIYGLPSLAQYSPLSTFIPSKEPRTVTRNYDRFRNTNSRDCCSYHRDI